MKHIFFIQSNITYIAAQSIIVQLKINPENVRFLVLNHFNKIEFPYSIYDFEEDFKFLFREQSFWSRLISEDGQLRQFDSKINEFVQNESFVLYLPNVYGKAKQALINHKKCVQVNFIEEGMMAYSFTDTYKGDFYKNLNLKKKILASISRLLFKFRMRRQFTAKNFYDTSVIRKKNKIIFYGFSEKAYSKYKIENLLVIPMVTTSTEISLPENSTVFVLDTLPENHHVEYELFLKSISNALKKSNFKIYLKFHPLQAQNTIDDITTFCKKENINIQFIKRDTIIEDIIINSKKLRFYGYISALLFYAKLNNHEVNCLIDDFKNDEKFKDYLAKQDFDFKKLLSTI